MEGNVRIKERLQRKAALAGIPISGTFELTPRCNLSCRMCYIRMTPEEMEPYGRELTAQEWISLGEEATQSGMRFLLLTGGEPMLRPDFPQVYDAMSQMGLSISINTNGTMLREQVRDLLEKRPPSQLNVTLYGPREETYEALCGNAHAFVKTLDTLRWARDLGICLNVNVTVTPWNMDQLAELEALAERENLRLRQTYYNFPPSRRNAKTDFTRIAPEDVGRLIAQREYRLQGAENLIVRANCIEKSMQLLPERQVSEISEGESMNMLGKTSTSDKQKALCVAMLNYGAAAQEYFGYNTDSLMNAELTAEQQALVAAYDKTLFTGAVAADSNKIGAFAATSGFSKKSATVSFESAFCVNYYFTPNATVSGDMTLYIWTPKAYAAAGTLTADNAETMTMVAGSNGSYWGQVIGIAPRNLDDTYYVAGVYTDESGNTCCTGVIAYSLSRYCISKAVDGNEMQELASAAAMYGYYAKQYFTT